MTDRKVRKMLSAILPIETERLYIRQICLDDSYDMYEYASIPEVSEFLLWHPHVNLSATEGYIEAIQKRYLKGLYADWAVVLKENGKMIGTCGYVSFDNKNKNCEIGYVLSPKYQKCGYMTEAMTALINLTFGVLELERITLRIIDKNHSSIALAKKLGFELDYVGEMVVKEEKQNICYYVLNKK